MHSKVGLYMSGPRLKAWPAQAKRGNISFWCGVSSICIGYERISHEDNGTGTWCEAIQASARWHLKGKLAFTMLV
eukprot:scaffold91713_cov19-Tisochrysis_lutea.AAC.2